MGKERKHPMQRIEVASDGVIRFRRNNIIRDLVDSGAIDLNKTAAMDYSAAAGAGCDEGESLTRRSKEEEAEANEGYPGKLSRVRPPTLSDAICFQVDNRSESNPYEAGPIVVVVDTEGLAMHFCGSAKVKWRGTWTELRWLLMRIRDERKREEIEQAARSRRAAERTTEEEVQRRKEIRELRAEWRRRSDATRER